mmetsp:Transcript_49697/g.83306  ORF Transcript_49697/g.83306 Transcript_49697/m.83306 type:complete len:87 (-) Transcript_49697:428-688(-)
MSGGTITAHTHLGVCVGSQPETMHLGPQLRNLQGRCPVMAEDNRDTPKRGRSLEPHRYKSQQQTTNSESKLIFWAGTSDFGEQKQN